MVRPRKEWTSDNDGLRRALRSYDRRPLPISEWPCGHGHTPPNLPSSAADAGYWRKHVHRSLASRPTIERRSGCLQPAPSASCLLI